MPVTLINRTSPSRSSGISKALTATVLPLKTGATMTSVNPVAWCDESTTTNGTAARFVGIGFS